MFTQIGNAGGSGDCRETLTPVQSDVTQLIILVTRLNSVPYDLQRKPIWVRGEWILVKFENVFLDR